MKYKIGDICEVNKRSLKKNDGYEIINYLDTANLNQGRIDEIVSFDLLNEKAPSRAKRIVQVNDILISTVRPNQLHYGLIENPVENLVVSTGFTVLSPDLTKVDPFYLYSMLTLQSTTEYLQSIAEDSTSAYPAVKPNVISNLSFDFPELIIQRKIGTFFKNLFSKIELNNQMIATLEELAATLFKRWFVDFEFPDENGNPYKSNGGKMVDSELGEIPEGWKVKKVGETVKIVRGASPRPIQEFMVQSGRPWVKISDANATFSPYLYSTKEYIKSEGISKSRTVESGTLILSNSATPGIPKIMKITASVHDGWLIFADYTEALYEEFMYLFLNKERESILQLSNGSVFRNLKTDILKNYPCVVPSEKVLQDFELIIKPVFKKIDISGIEIRSLSKIRNTLLPKLVSGEVEV